MQNPNNQFNRNQRRGNNNNNRLRRKRNNKQTVAQKQNAFLEIMNHTKVPRALAHNTPFPPKMKRVMRYIDPTLILKNPGSSFLVREFKVNDLFDPDPLIGGGSVSGYTELSAIYGRNLVTHASVELRVTSIEPLEVLNYYIIYRDAQPSTIITSPLLAESSAETAPATHIVQTGQANAMSKAVIPRIKIPLASVLGRPLEYLTNMNFTAASGSSPNQQIWMAIVVYGYLGTTNITNGAACVISIDFTVEWFSGQRVLDEKSPPMVARQKYKDRLAIESLLESNDSTLSSDI